MKTSAAWLIERAGFSRGYGDGRAGISTKHTLALINRGERDHRRTDRARPDDRRRRPRDVRHPADTRAGVDRPSLVAQLALPPGDVLSVPNTMRQLLALVLAAAGLAATPALASAAPPANDAYLASCPSTTREFTASTDTTEATTQADLFNPSRDGAPLGGGGPETTTCKGTAFGKTVWYDLAPQVDGGVVIRATGFATVVARLRVERARRRRSRGWSTARRTRPSTISSSSVRAKRHYTIQVGGAGGVGGPLNLRVDYFPDRDRDGQYRRARQVPDRRRHRAVRRLPAGADVAAAAHVRQHGHRHPDHPPRGSTGSRRARRSSSAAAAAARRPSRARRTGTVELSRFAGRAANAGATISVKVTMAAQRHGHLPLRRDRQVPVLAGARRRHQGVTGTLSERPHG